MASGVARPWWHMPHAVHCECRHERRPFSRCWRQPPTTKRRAHASLDCSAEGQRLAARSVACGLPSCVVGSRRCASQAPASCQIPRIRSSFASAPSLGGPRAALAALPARGSPCLIGRSPSGDISFALIRLLVRFWKQLAVRRSSTQRTLGLAQDCVAWNPEDLLMSAPASSMCILPRQLGRHPL